MQIITALGFFPFKFNWEKNTNRTISIVAALIFPIGMSLGLPLFLYSIVMEKETRLVDYMKTNGMRMKNYWFSWYTFNIIPYVITIILFLYTGISIFKYAVLIETSRALLMIILFGWGLV